MLSSEVLPQKSIYLVGPHSSGKTTLAKALLVHYGQNSVTLLQETARKVLKEKGYTREDIESPRCFEMQKDILFAQFTAEQSIFDGREVNIISDRAGVDPILYAMKYSSCPQDWERLCTLREWKVLRDRYMDSKNSVVILVQPCRQFLVDDGTRKMPLDWEEWESFGKMFEMFLKQQKIPFKVIGANCVKIEDRVNNAVKWASEDFMNGNE